MMEAVDNTIWAGSTIM